MDDNTSTEYFLHQNCRPGWPDWICVTANVCGLCSTGIWFIVLLPQVWKNFRRKSVRGLSILWATANFTASLINLFFVFKYADIPIYGKISAVYMPILEITILIQFLLYGVYGRKEKMAFLAGCLVVWSTVVTVNLIFSVQNFVEYAAITLWCIETFPQIILNMKLQSSSGQSTWSVAIAMFGKTMDFISNNALVLPLQYVIMIYYSSSVAYINGIQVAWYFGQDIKNGQDTESQSCGCLRGDKYGATKSTTDNRPAQTDNVVNTETVIARTPCVNMVRFVCIGTLSIFLASFVVGFMLNIHSYYGVFAPISIAAVIFGAKIYLYGCRSSSFTLKTL